jgi:ABC-type glycerol-3-phosphate transport system substrate-binding protein
MSAAVLKVSADSKDAEAFLRYVTRPDAATVWKSGGGGETPSK